jgi:hypothetical protein
MAFPHRREPSRRGCFCRLQSYKVTLLIFNRLRVGFSAKCNFVTEGRARWREGHVRKKYCLDLLGLTLIYLDLVGFGSRSGGVMEWWLKSRVVRFLFARLDRCKFVQIYAKLLKP